jgi:hypothetical protein
MNDDDGTERNDDPVIDKARAEAEADKGNRTLVKLLNHASDDWASWSITIVGWRALHSLAFAKAHTTNTSSQAYRDAMGALLRKKSHAAYDQIDRPTRSYMSKLCDRIEDIDIWYGGLPATDRLKWKHPQAIAKHAPKHLLAGGLRGHNWPKPTSKEKSTSPAEEDRLRALLIALIREFVAPMNQGRADALLAQVYPAGEQDLNDSLEGISDRDGDEPG